MAETDYDLDLLRQALSGRILGRRVLYYGLVRSTIDEMWSLAEQGEPEGTVIVSEEQTEGRGRFNRAWFSPWGQSILISVLLRPTLAQLPFVNMAAALAVSRAIAETSGLQTSIKWPNDVRVNGRKISGVLIESAIDDGEPSHSIVGIGLNVNFDPSLYPEIGSTATSILRETGKKANRTAILRTVLESLDSLYSQIRTGRSLTGEWAAEMDMLGQNIKVRWQDHILEGRANSVDSQGNLIILKPDGSSFTVSAGEVTSQE